jgi:hypothetical protein
VLANKDGILQVIGWNKIETVTVCKVNLNATIAALQLGGAIGMMQTYTNEIGN